MPLQGYQYLVQKTFFVCLFKNEAECFYRAYYPGWFQPHRFLLSSAFHWVKEQKNAISSEINFFFLHCSIPLPRFTTAGIQTATEWNLQCQLILLSTHSITAYNEKTLKAINAAEVSLSSVLNQTFYILWAYSYLSNKVMCLKPAQLGSRFICF